MIDFSQLTFKSLTFQKVGNKAKAEGVQLADAYYSLKEEWMKNILLDYFLSPFKVDEFHHFTHEEGLDQNVLFQICQRIFADRSSHLEASKGIAQHLYKCAENPKVKSGDLFVAYFADCLLEDELVDAIGIFKAENKELFLHTEAELTATQGISIKKLDKGAIIFNTMEENGYRLLMVDRGSRNNIEAEAWQENFLKLGRVHDNSYSTQSYLNLCKEYTEDVFTEEGDKKDQVLFLNKSINYFTEHELFDLEDFATQVIEEPKKIEEFKNFKKEYEADNGFVTQSDFRISQPAVKTMKRKFRSLIKLDTNIDIRISPSEDPEIAETNINRGFDEERKMFYYKVFFNEEA